MKISEVTLENAKSYLRVEDNEDDNIITACMNGAKAYIKTKTGLSEEKINEIEDLWYPFMVLTQSMYDDRTNRSETYNVNTLVDDILYAHRTNFLPTGDEDVD